jgi:hypothetical protein
MQYVQTNYSRGRSRSRRRDPRRKFIGWAIMGGAVLLIAGLFFIPHGQQETSTAVASAGVPSAQASAPGPAASASQAPAPEVATASAAPQASAAIPGGQAAVVDLSAMDQPARKAFLLRLIDQGVFTGVQAPPAPKVGVTPLFQGLSSDLKQQFIAVVDAYVYNGAAGPDPLQVIDATSGKVVGTYTPGHGLKLE